jgi:hypothetical protein
MSADNYHDHLHRERNQSPKALSALESEARGTHATENPKPEDDNDTQKSDNQGIWEPALAPAGERQTDPCRKPLPKPPISALKRVRVALEPEALRHDSYFVRGANTHTKLAASSVLPLPFQFAICG